MKTGSPGSATTTVAKARNWRPTPGQRCSSTGSNWNGWYASKAGLKKSAQPKATPTLPAARSIRGSVPGPARRVRSLPAAVCWSATPPSTVPGSCCIRHVPCTGAAIACSLIAGSSGRAGRVACTTACVTGWTAINAGFASDWRRNGPLNANRRWLPSRSIGYRLAPPSPRHRDTASLPGSRPPVHGSSTSSPPQATRRCQR